MDRSLRSVRLAAVFLAVSCTVMFVMSSALNGILVSAGPTSLDGPSSPQIASPSAVQVLPILASKSTVSPSVTDAVSSSTDWPTYLQNPDRTSATYAPTTLSSADAADLTTLWTYQAPYIGKGAPNDFSASATVVGNVVYVGNWNGDEYALNATTGAVIWHQFLGEDESSPCGYRGVSSSATVVNGTLYVGGGNGYWYALSAASGSVKHKLLIGDVADGYYNWASPLIFEGYAYVGVSSNCDDPLVPGGLLQVNLTTFAVAHFFNTTQPEVLGGSVWGSPSIDAKTNTVYFATGNDYEIANPAEANRFADAIIAVNAANVSKLDSYWTIPDDQQAIDGDFGTTPTMFESSTGTPLVGALDKNHYFYAFNASDLASGPLWRDNLTTGDSIGSAAFAQGLLFVAAGGDNYSGVDSPGWMYALYPDNGTIDWLQPLLAGESLGSAPAYTNGLVFVTGGTDVYVFNATTGTELQELGCGEPFFSPPAIADDKVFVGCTSGQEFAFGLTSTPLTIESFQAVPSTITLDQSTQFQTSVSGGSGVYTYAYSGLPSNCLSANSSTLSCTPSKTGTYTVTVTVTDTQGGSQQAHATLVVNPVAEMYSVTFTESGLPASTSWSVTLNGALESSSTTSIAFSEPNGTYSYTIGSVTGYSPSPASGMLTVNGAALSQPITWTKSSTLYAVTFSESGLPSKSLWNVTAGSPPDFQSTTGTTLVFEEPLGTLSFTIGPPAGYGVSHMSSASQSSVTVTGKMTVTVQFKALQTVTFTETGLPSGDSWSVELTSESAAGNPPPQSASSTTTTVGFVVVKDGYDYTVTLPSGYKTSDATGSFYAGGSPIKIKLTVTADPPVPPGGTFVALAGRADAAS